LLIWNILLPLDKAVVIWYIFYRFGIFCQEKSGNLDSIASSSSASASARRASLTGAD
jgi:hypothetical protein